MEHTLCGSPLYMAPEIFKNKNYNEKSDLWSLGIILFEMVSGYHPFKSNNIIELNKKIDTLQIPKLYKLLEKDFNKRLTLDELYNSQWLNNNNSFINKNKNIKKSICIQKKIDDLVNLKSKPIDIPKQISFESEEDFLIIQNKQRFKHEKYKQNFYNYLSDSFNDLFF